MFPDEELLNQLWLSVPGQAHVRRALEVAIAGKHSALVMGPAGYGGRDLVRVAYRLGAICEFHTPCPCGLPASSCCCEPSEIKSHQSTFLSPLDYWELLIELEGISKERLVSAVLGDAKLPESVDVIHSRVLAARERPEPKLSSTQEIRDLLLAFAQRTEASSRRLQSVLKVARTIARLEGAGVVKTHHIGEAIQYGWIRRNEYGLVAL